jgi:hypothetical protein
MYVCAAVWDRNLKVYTSISAICGQKRPKSGHNDSKCSYVWRTAMRSPCCCPKLERHDRSVPQVGDLGKGCEG